MIPAIVLVNTQMPENIGATARAMMNFGLKDLRLVAPREIWPNQRAYDLAGHGATLLDNAKLFTTTREAVSDCQLVYAATARSREMVKPVLLPAEAADHMTEHALPTALMFGPERSGLTNDDVTLADAIITIPTATELASLNIGQSVVVLAYQWFVASARPDNGSNMRATTGPKASPLITKSEPATKAELIDLLDHLERKLDAVDFWKVPEKKPKMWLNLRNIFTRANLTEQEVRSLHGVIGELSKRN